MERFAIRLKNWFGHEWDDSGVFSWTMFCFVKFRSVWKRKLLELHKKILFVDSKVFLMVSLRGNMVCSLNVTVPFSHSFSKKND